MGALERINSVVMKLTWLALAVGLVNHFVYELMPRLWEGRLLNLIWVLVAMTIVGQAVHWAVRRRAVRSGAGADRRTDAR